jgi:putative membrane protein
MNSAIMAFLHHLAAFTLVGTLIYEHTAFRKDITFAEARRLQRMDLVYGISAGVVLIIVILRVFYFE